MKSIYILILPSRVTLYQVGSDFRLAHIMEFMNHEDGRADFSLWISQLKDVVFYVVLDGFKESFHIEHIPAVWFSDQKAIINRRFNQFAHGTIFRRARRDTSWLNGFKRGRIQYVLSSIPENIMVDGWLDVIDYYKFPLMGVYTISSLMGEYVRNKLSFTLSPTVIICADEGFGLRQFLFVGRNLVFYRVNPEPKEKWNREGCRQEMQRAAHYFSVALNIAMSDLNFSYLSFENSDYILGLFKSLSSSNVKVVSAHEFFGGGDGFGKSILNIYGFSELSEFIVFWLSFKKNKNHYAPVNRLRYKKLYEFKMGVNILYLMLCLLVLWANASICFNFWGMWVNNSHVMTLSDNIKESISKIKNGSDLDYKRVVVMNDVVTIYDAISSRPRVYGDVSEICKILKDMGYVVYLDQVHWSIEPYAQGDIKKWKVHIAIRGKIRLREYENVLGKFYDEFKEIVIKKFHAQQVEMVNQAADRTSIRVAPVGVNDVKSFELNFDYLSEVR